MTNLLTPTWYTPEDGPGGSFKIRGLTGFEWLDLQGMIKSRQGDDWLMLAKAGQGELERAEYQFVLEHGVLDWRDLPPHALMGDHQEPFEPVRVKEMCTAHVIAVTLEILGRSMITEDTEKNLSSQPKLPETALDSTAPSANGSDTATP